MGYCLEQENMNQVLKDWAKDYVIYGPVCFREEGAFSDTDLIRYGEIRTMEEMELERKSRFSMKEILMPLSETLFYFTEDEVKEASAYRKKGAVVFLRSCDLHAVKRLDEIYLKQGFEDAYYHRLRENMRFVLIGCKESFENCFCVSMDSNRSEDYDMGMSAKDGMVYIDSRNPELEETVKVHASHEESVTPDFVTDNHIRVNIPEQLDLKVAKSAMWEEYNSRCINCGRCNFSCPTCTCFTMQDIFYTDNGKVGERRRVWASCMTDGYTDVAGGGAYRKKNGERMRFKVLHKIYDYKKRNGYHMCVGCGRCEDVCPEYISFTACINKLDAAIEEVTSHEA